MAAIQLEIEHQKWGFIAWLKALPFGASSRQRCLFSTRLRLLTAPRVKKPVPKKANNPSHYVSWQSMQIIGWHFQDTPINVLIDVLILCANYGVRDGILHRWSLILCSCARRSHQCVERYCAFHTSNMIRLSRCVTTARLVIFVELHTDFLPVFEFN